MWGTECWFQTLNRENGRRPRPVDLQIPPIGSIVVIIPGMNDDEACQCGECEGCNSVIMSNRKTIYCPFCGIAVGLT